jgi:hypothetical protein
VLKHVFLGFNRRSTFFSQHVSICRWTGNSLFPDLASSKSKKMRRGEFAVAKQHGSAFAFL